MIGRAATLSFNLFCWSRCLINSLQINAKTSKDCYEWSQRCPSTTKEAASNYLYNLKLVLLYQYIHKLSICLQYVSMSRGKLAEKILHNGTFLCKTF